MTSAATVRLFCDSIRLTSCPRVMQMYPGWMLQRTDEAQGRRSAGVHDRDRCLIADDLRLALEVEFEDHGWHRDC